ncbi:MAG TPA: DUF481 domain-containing protein [Pseudomonadales bacterium]
MRGKARNSGVAWLTAVFLPMATLAAALPAQAADEEKNAVVLTSGNRMTGGIVKMTRGKLLYAIDGAGPVAIDWNNVASLDSEQDLDVELASGRRLSGSITSSPGGLLVTGDTGSDRTALEDVVRITPIAATPIERTDGHVEVGFDLLSANDELDLTLNAELENRTWNYLSQVALQSLVRRRDGDTVQRRNVADGSIRRILRDRWFALGRLRAEEDEELDLDSRFLVGGGAGRTLLQSNRTVVTLYGGLDSIWERYAVQSGTDRSTEAFLAVEWDWFEIGGDVELLTGATVYTGLEHSRTRLDLGVSLRHELFASLYWSLNLFQTYDSDPPEGLENHDAGLSFTLGRGF